mgnify:CR=1 FL=1
MSGYLETLELERSSLTQGQRSHLEKASRQAARLDRLITDLFDLARLDTRITALLAPYRGRPIFVFHPAFGYFADSYGLEQVAVEHGAKEPGARSAPCSAD